ncbi:hypothetical protein GGD40_005567 [Paraburkholderia bryophila]|uniref:Uncharacterized protein n=1 Tax=Paraburkholderia bryophila TaxID=420952 RepID=A0A7Y9WTV5_9BURK|nr:hypothetical protein [Paraburkholderia bryophila]
MSIEWPHERSQLLTLVSGPVSSEQSTSPAAPAAVSQFSECSSHRARFFICRLRRNAPETHLDQVKGNTTSAFSLGGYAAPEELWCRNASMGFVRTIAWAPGLSAPTHSWLAFWAIRFDCIWGTATRHPIQSRWLFASRQSGLAGRSRNSYAKQRRHKGRVGEELHQSLGRQSHFSAGYVHASDCGALPRAFQFKHPLGFRLRGHT